ncbi:cytochrome P450 [Cystobacter fuscus]
MDAAERAAAERGETGPERHMDLIAEFAYPLPVKVISDMLGIPPEDRDMVKGWTENLVRNNNGRGMMDPENRAKMREFTDYLRRLFADRRKQPADDMISQLLRIEEDGDKLNEEETLSTVFILYLAGHVTTVNLIGNGVFALLRHPDQLAKFKADPGRPGAWSRRPCGTGVRSTSSHGGSPRRTWSWPGRTSPRGSR